MGSTQRERRLPALAPEGTPPFSEVPFAAEEVLVRDARAGLTPAQMVERKLISLLKGAPLPVSHLQTAARRTCRS